jgi:hypothetical protein
MSGVSSDKYEWQAIASTSQLIFALRKSVMVGSQASLWKMKNTQYYLAGMEQLTTAAVVGTKSAS